MQDTCINECHEVNCVEAGSGRGGLCWYGASLGLLKPIPLGNGGVELARASMLDRAVHKLGQPVGEVVQPGLALPSEKVGFWAELPTLNQPAVSTGWVYVLARPLASLTGQAATSGAPKHGSGYLSPGKGANQAICAVEHRHNAATRLAEAPQSPAYRLSRCEIQVTVKMSAGPQAGSQAHFSVP